MSPSEVIAEMLDSARKFNLFYLQKVSPENLHHRPTIDGRLGNSVYWIAGHLVWAEVDGVIKTTGGDYPDIPWLAEFSIGRKFEDMTLRPSMEEIMQTMEQVHRSALDHVRSHSEEDLALPCFIVPANWNTTRQKAFYHFIRHESFHTGQISLIAKGFGAQLP